MMPTGRSCTHGAAGPKDVGWGLPTDRRNPSTRGHREARADVTSPSDAAAAVQAALDRFGRLDVLVNNAGVPKHKHILDITSNDIEATFRLNILAPMELTRAVCA